MLRITAHETSATVRLQLEGLLTGPWVAELEQAYLAALPRLEGRRLIVDIRDLTRFDAAARYLLALLQRDGAIVETDEPFVNTFALGSHRDGLGGRA